MSSIKRVSAIPVVQNSLATVHGTLSTNRFTKVPYNLIYSTVSSQLPLNSPWLNPYMEKADGYANRGLDVVQQKYPYPFEARPEEMYKDIKTIPDHAVGVGKKTAEDLDHWLVPLVDRYEGALAQIVPDNKDTTATSNGHTFPTKGQSKTQFGRAYRVTVNKRNQALAMYAEYLKRLPIVHNIVGAIYNLNNALGNTFSFVATQFIETKDSGKARMKNIEDIFLNEFNRIQDYGNHMILKIEQRIAPLKSQIEHTASTLRAISKDSETASHKAIAMKETVLHDLPQIKNELIRFAFNPDQKRTEKGTQSNGQANGVAHPTKWIEVVDERESERKAL